ncbi:MAG: FAD-dependent monooxygenase [Candidatus Heimdallarchaeota archaeon]|nr:FAD-dependent monooxygenase [Candidatus Heimdallarchaeota archaeon]
MGESKDDKIIMVGAGLAGSLMATYLCQQGYQVELYEMRSDMRTEKAASAGKSINLALSPRGIRALEEIGVFDDIMQIAIPMKGRMIHDTDGNLTFQPYGKDEHEVINSVSRGELNKKLMDYAEATGNCKIYFNHPCVGFDPVSGESIIKNNDTNEEIRIKGQTTIASDGAGSAVRYVMQRLGRFNYQQHFLEHGYKELEIPADENGNHVIEKNALHIWPRGTFMMIALPNPDGSFTVTLFHPFEGPQGLDALNTKEKINEFFNEYFPDAVPLMPTLVDDFFRNPNGLLGTIRCDPWYIEEKALLIGDASHAIVPFYGQGMNAAFEDCRVLNDLIKEYGNDWQHIYPKFNKLRKENVEAIADLALDNFIEMRDRIADEKFLLIKKAEMTLYERYPDEIVSKYSMVTFSHIPYSEAKIKGEILVSTVTKYCENISSIEEFNFEAAKNEVLSKYRELNNH